LYLPRALAAAVVISCAAFSPVVRAGGQKPPNDLDAFMAKALERREVNRKTLKEYILTEVERIEILGPGRVPLHRLKREFLWYVRDGMHVRSPVRFDGVPIGDADRRQYEDQWIRREHERQENEAKRKKEKAKNAEKAETEQRPPIDAKPEPAPDPNKPSLVSQVSEPRFVSESYFLDFKFEPGNYYLAGRETLDGHDVMRIEYYPTNLFNDNDEDKRVEKKPGGKEKPLSRRDQRNRQKGAEIDRAMNKTTMVTLWVDPAEHQIVKFTFDNVWMDFLPAGWMVHVDDLRASMVMGQPFEGVWLPRSMSIHAGASLANGSYEVTYARDFSDYRQADVKSRIKSIKEMR
jgi:hypothetical protein